MKIGVFLRAWLLAVGLVLTSAALSSSSWAAIVCEKFLVERDATAETRAIDSIDELSIGTYNVENLFLHLGHHEPKPGAPGKMEKITPPQTKSPEKVAGVAKAIRELDLDIVVLQEVENIEALEALNAQHLDGKYKAVLVEGNDPRGIDVAFLVKKDLPFVFENHSYRRETWVDPRLRDAHDSPIFSRDLPALVVRAQGQPVESKPLFVLFGTHFKSKRDFRDPTARMQDPESRLFRAAQVKRAVEIIERYREEYGADLPIMIAGDFNGSVHQEREFRALKEDAQLVDGFDVSPNRLNYNERVTHVYFGQRGRPERNQIDAVFVSQSLREHVSESAVYRYKDQNGRPWPLPWKKWQRDSNPSDHWPVRIKLKLQALLKQAGLIQ